MKIFAKLFKNFAKFCKICLREGDFLGSLGHAMRPDASSARTRGTPSTNALKKKTHTPEN